MRIRITKEIPICVDNIYGVNGYLHIGEEYDVFPTDDGMKFKALGIEISPYDITYGAELVK